MSARSSLIRPVPKLGRLLAVTAISMVAMAGLASAASAATWSPLGHKFSVTTPGAHSITFNPPGGINGSYTCDLSFGGTIPATPSSTVELPPEMAVSGCTNSHYTPEGLTVEGSFTPLGTKKLLLTANSTTSISLKGGEFGFILKLKTPGGQTACKTLMRFSSLTGGITGSYSNATRTFSFTGQAGTYWNEPPTIFCPTTQFGVLSQTGPITASGSMYFTDLFNNGPITLVP